MSKRFIDTGLFDDDWFMELSKDAKILWLYFITKCDHAGMIKLNPKLCKVQTDIKELETVIKQLSNRLVTVSEHLYFIPKFIDFQYPGFPNSKVRSQISAIAILKKHGLIDEENLTLIKGLDNSYEHEHDTDNDNGKEKKSLKHDFDYSFISPEWLPLFTEWINYKKSRNEMYKTQDSLRACYRNLLKLSNNNLVSGREVIDQATGNNWAGLFPLKQGPKIEEPTKLSIKTGPYIK